ncbi:MAG TPA: MBL fold metallo-hydrolase [Thermoanaerobaculia bacterium]|nr:MBL fold metallo-hydrolase [Thermoanaerobaculia bacterium]
MSDYPQGRGRVSLEAAGIAIEGVSIAGHESYFKLPGFRSLLEFGRAPEDTLGYGTICLTHGHLDHAAGIAHHASRRTLTGLGPARVFAPAEAIPDLTVWLEACERLEQVRYGTKLEAAVPGESVALRRDLELRFLPGRHRVPTVGYLFTEIRRKLKDEHVGRSGPEIAALRDRGMDVTRREEVALLAYPGDCGPAIFDAVPALFTARVLLIECSFFAPDDVGRAHAYEHLHISDFAERAELFQNETVVLTHFTLRSSDEEIRESIAGLPETLRKRCVAFLPEEGVIGS